MSGWAKCHHKSKELTIHVNLALATHIIEEAWGSRICWPYEGEDGSYLDVKECASELLESARQAPRGAGVQRLADADAH